jgi:hypothetical protein
MEYHFGITLMIPAAPFQSTLTMIFAFRCILLTAQNYYFARGFPLLWNLGLASTSILQVPPHGIHLSCQGGSKGPWKPKRQLALAGQYNFRLLQSDDASLDSIDPSSLVHLGDHLDNAQFRQEDIIPLV